MIISYKPIYSFLIFLLISFSAVAQKKPIQFQSINEIGIAGGQSEVNYVFQTVNGIKFSDWFSGIGIGVDYYRYKTLPLFFDARRYFGKEKKGFVYGDLGYNFPLKNKPGKEIGYYYSYHFTGGIYTDIGIGFKTKFIKKSFLVFSLGQSYKPLQTKIGIAPECLGCQTDFFNYKFGYGRIMLKTGLEF